MDISPRIRDALTPEGQKLAILPLEGRLDARGATTTRQLLHKVIEFGYPNLLLNFQGVTFIDSSGLGVLISALHKCRASGGNLGLCRVNEPVKIALELASLDQVLPCFLDEAAGIDQFPLPPKGSSR